MQLSPSTTIRDIPITKAFLKQIIEEKLHQFGFIGDDDHVLKLDTKDIPESFMIQVKRQDMKEVEVVRQRFNGT